LGTLNAAAELLVSEAQSTTSKAYKLPPGTSRVTVQNTDASNALHVFFGKQSDTATTSHFKLGTSAPGNIQTFEFARAGEFQWLHIVAAASTPVAVVQIARDLQI